MAMGAWWRRPWEAYHLLKPVVNRLRDRLGSHRLVATAMGTARAGAAPRVTRPVLFAFSACFWLLRFRNGLSVLKQQRTDSPPKRKHVAIS